MVSRQKGFTLVEIAIVLFIIGLLLGGILKGQELITSARVRNLADQNSGIQAAYYGFIDRYRQIPGDMLGTNTPGGVCNVIGNSAPGCAGGTTAIAGNGNGRLDDEDWGESSAAWAHLSSAGFIQGSFQGGATNEATYTAQTVAPLNAFNGRLMLTRSNEFETVATPTPSSRLLLIIGGQIPVNVMRELDLKIDDGQPHTGVLLSTVASGGDLGAVASRTVECTVTVSGTEIWDINANEQDCNAAFLY